MVIVVMGVAGAGKSTVARELSGRLHWPLLDADDYHSAENVAKMSAGVALSDEDRAPWLARVAAAIRDVQKSEPNAVVACSALRHAYRDVLRAATNDVRFVYIALGVDDARARLQHRRGHFVDARLIDSQFATLEAPAADEALTVDGRQSAQTIVATIIDTFGLKR